MNNVSSSGGYLYVCSSCGAWRYSFGFGEAFAIAAGASYQQHCCDRAMQRYSSDEKIARPTGDDAQQKAPMSFSAQRRKRGAK